MQASVRTLRVLLGLSLPAATGFAQAAPAPRPNPAPEEIVRLDEFTVTSSLASYAEKTSSATGKVPMDTLDVAASVQVLNAAFLADTRASRLEDVFGYVTGLNKQGTNANAFTLRGFAAAGSNLQSVQVDGMPGPPSRFASPPTVNVERLEVLKGPTSVLYGQANPGGMINIVTKSPKATRQNVFSTFLSTYAGQTSGFGDTFSWTASVDLTGPIDEAKRWLFRVVASYEDQESFRDYYYQKNKYFYPSLTWRPSPDTSVTVKYEWVREDRQATDGLAVPFLNAHLLPPINTNYQAPNALDTDYGDSWVLNAQTRVLDTWTARFTYRRTVHDDSRTALETAQGAIVANTTNYLLSTIRPRYRVQENEKDYDFIDANIWGTVGPEKFQHTLIAGINGGREWLRTNRLAFGPFTAPVNLYASVPNVAVVYPTNPTGQQDRQTPFWNYGAYVSDQIKLGRHWNASIGFRREKQDSYQKEITPTTVRGIKQSMSDTLPTYSLMFKPWTGVSLYATYCEGFKPQAPGNVDINNDPNFPPETSQQQEFGVKVDALGGRLTGNVAVYEIEKQNVLTATGTTSPSGNPIANLSGLQRSKGVELGVGYLPVPNWQVQLGYTYIDARVITSTTATIVGARLDNTPRNSGSLWTRYNFDQGSLRGLGVGLGVVHTGRRHAIITNNPAARLELPGFTRADVGLYYTTRRVDYALNVSNVTDKTYVAGALPGGADRLNPGEPRRVTLSARVAF